MPTQANTKRDGLLRAIEESLKTKVIAYITGDRPNLVAQVSSDAIPKFRRHLEAIGDVDSISLFLYTRGGDTNVPWRLVNLIREYCTKFNVLVPFRAHSAGTLICMGADEILAGRMGELTSIDPSVANPFNPPDPTNPLTRVPISVEDVNAFKELARRFGLDEKDPAQNRDVFLSLASKVEPLALGNVERAHSQIKKLAADLLSLHPPKLMDEKEKEIVRTLTVGLYSHLHIISRKEAQSLGLNVKIADKATDALLWNLFEDYSGEMELDNPFNPAQMVTGQNTSLPVRATRAFVESIGKTDAFVSEGTISRVQPGGFQLPPGMQISQVAQLQIQFNFEGWRVVR